MADTTHSQRERSALESYGGFEAYQCILNEPIEKIVSKLNYDQRDRVLENIEILKENPAIRIFCSSDLNAISYVIRNSRFRELPEPKPHFTYSQYCWLETMFGFMRPFPSVTLSKRARKYWMRIMEDDGTFNVFPEITPDDWVRVMAFEEYFERAKQLASQRETGDKR